MKKKLFVTIIVFVCLYSIRAFALDPMGPPKSILNQGQFLTGFDFSVSEQDVEASATIGGITITDTIEGVVMGKYYATVGYGLMENVDLSVRFGLWDAEFNDDGAHLIDNGQFAYGLAVKTTLADQDNLSWGGLFSVSRGEFDDSNIGGSGVSADIDWLEIQVAFGPTYDLDDVCIYGGPFVHFIDGDMDLKSGSTKISADLEEKSVLGGYIGAQFDITENTFVNVEYQLTGDAQGLAGSIAWKW